MDFNKGTFLGLVLLFSSCSAMIKHENIASFEKVAKDMMAEKVAKYGYSRKINKHNLGHEDTYFWAREECARDMWILDAAQMDPATYGEWILPFMNADARGTFPPKGALLGSIDATGSYDLCAKIYPSGQDVYDNSTGSPLYIGNHNFSTHYCKVTYYTPKFEVGLSEGWCVPETCNRTDMWLIVEENKSNGTIDTAMFPHHSAYCGEKVPLKDNKGGIVALTISAFFVALVVVATLADGFYTWYKSYRAVEDAALNSPAKDTGHVNAAFESGEKTQIGANGESSNGVTQLKLEQEPPKKTTQPNIFYRALVSFSLLKTVPLVVKTGGSRSTFGCMNGIRVFSMMWIVLGHTWVLELPNGLHPYSSNILMLNNELKTRFSHQIVNQVDLPVESFFLIGAILVTYSFIKTLKRLDDGGVVDWIKELALYVFHRYWRLTPIFAALMMIYGNLWQYLGHGPNFPEHRYDAENCKKYWWVNLLYIQNLYSDNGAMLGCMGWSWYLACDFQYFIIAPVFVIALYKKPIFGYILLALGWVGTTIARAVIMTKAYNGEINPFNDIYVRPWTRFGPYAQGILLGYIIYRTKCKVKMHKLLVLVCWFLAAALALIVLFAPWKKVYWPKPLAVTWDVMKRDAFSIAIAWVVFACVTGYGGLANTFLGWNFFNPLSKLTYCSYLIHPIIHAMALSSRRQVFYVQDLTAAYLFIGNLILSILCSFGLTLVFEVPFGEFEKVIIPRGKKK